MCAISKKRINAVFVPYTADKGDCPFCSDGVLERDSGVESYFNTSEGYSCNSCGRFFIESLLTGAHYMTSINIKKSRYFIPVLKRKGANKLNPLKALSR